jgi:hypothetical protein
VPETPGPRLAARRPGSSQSLPYTGAAGSPERDQLRDREARAIGSSGQARPCRLTSIPGAVVQLRSGFLPDGAYGRDLGGCQLQSGAPQEDFIQPEHAEPLVPCKQPPVTNISSSTLSLPPRNFAGSGSGKPVEVRTKALVSDTRSAQAPIQSPSRESRLTGGQQADRRPRAPRPLAVGSQAQQLPPVKLAVQVPSLVQLAQYRPALETSEAVIPAAIAYLLPHIASTGCSTIKSAR